MFGGEGPLVQMALKLLLKIHEVISLRMGCSRDSIIINNHNRITKLNKTTKAGYNAYVQLPLLTETKGNKKSRHDVEDIAYNTLPKYTILSCWKKVYKENYQALNFTKH